MYRYYTKLLALFLLAVAASFSIAESPSDSAPSAAAVEIPRTAHATVELVSEQLLGMLEESQEKFDESPEEFYADIDAVISPWLDFGVWSKAVIGREYYADTTEDQRERFEAVFRDSLIQTYAKGLLSVEDSGYEVEPPHPGDEDKTAVSVSQTLYAGSDKVKAVYSMSKNEEGRWQFRNVILEGVNLGGTFRNQFKRAAEEYDRDMDKVIANWAPEA